MLQPQGGGGQRYGSKEQQVLELGSGEIAEQHEHFARCDQQSYKL
jgi:hypothetical protein